MRPPRGLLAVSYLLFALAGMFFMLWRPTVSLEQLLGWGFYVWNVFLIVGGLIGAIGAWNRKFRVEIIASPLLSSGLMVYGGSIIAKIDESRSPGVIAGLGSVFIGSALLFLGKGLAIWVHKIRVAEDVERRTVDGE